MQLYSADISPYASRCRIQVHHKDLPVQIVPPPGGMRSAEVLARNPIGKIPVLDLGDDALFESWAIMEYLESRFPEPPMRPADALAAAKLTALARFADLQLATAMFPLFLALRGTAGEGDVDQALGSLDTQFRTLDALLERKAPPPDGALDLADAALVPIVWYGQVMVRHFAKREVLDESAHTRPWWARVNAQAAAGRVIGELHAGLRAAMPALFPHD